MEQFNPFKCESERTRRLSLSLLFTAVLSWVSWIGVASNGFSQVQPMGWVIFFGVPIAIYLLILVVLPILRKSPREIRYLVSATLMWLFLVGAWGYIVEWESEFSSERYLALFFLPPVGAWLGFALWKWSRTG
ncbi:hypothetical protein [Candidatus Nitrotoga sp. M5]|uniref:hypothetical protein n=1 Tax=Candidatus Nitrotoga sp. M5 TaxID=2890409 RepID=UPI001EF3850B|nr:hypothetical protein [Candidatus Nitrotoga sp. M5]CAH1385917.1 membrane hypothetical protein [Candidatus Nitrotoga sp. M5]